MEKLEFRIETKPNQMWCATASPRNPGMQTHGDKQNILQKPNHRVTIERDGQTVDGQHPLLEWNTLQPINGSGHFVVNPMTSHPVHFKCNPPTFIHSIFGSVTVLIAVHITSKIVTATPSLIDYKYWIHHQPDFNSSPSNCILHRESS